MNYVLIGMPGSGKSTLGVLLAKYLGFSFLDTDLVIQNKESKLLREIIEEKGTDGFLRIEDDYLSIPFEEMERRLANEYRMRGVVLLEGQTLLDMYDARCRLYEKYADVTIAEQNLSLEETLQKVLEEII